MQIKVMAKTAYYKQAISIDTLSVHAKASLHTLITGKTLIISALIF